MRHGGLEVLCHREHVLRQVSRNGVALIPHTELSIWQAVDQRHAAGCVDA